MKNVRILTRGRSHLYNLALLYSAHGWLDVLFVLWPRFKFKGVNKVYSFYFLDEIQRKFNFILTTLFDNIFLRKNRIHIVDVNLVKYLKKESFSNICIDMPTNYWKIQDKRWLKEEKETGVLIDRRRRVREYLENSDEYFENAKRIIVPSNQAYSSLPDNLKEKSVIMPFVGYSLPKEMKVTFSKEIKQIICIGLVCPSKGWHYAIRGLNKTNKILSVDFYGAINEEYKHYLLSICSHNLQINFIGHVTENRLLSAIKNSDLCIHASVSEGLPLSLLNCLRAGTPLLCSSYSNMRDIVPDEYIYETYDIGDFFEKFQALPTGKTIKWNQHILTRQKIEESWLVLARNL